MRQGWEAIEALPEAERSFIAQELVTFKDRYFDKFKAVMSGMHGNGMGNGQISPELLWSLYQAQCAKDDTMAESLERYLSLKPDSKLVHINGSFHSDEHLGTAQKLALLNDTLKIAVVSICPVEGNLPTELNDSDKKLGDFIIYCHRQVLEKE